MKYTKQIGGMTFHCEMLELDSVFHLTVKVHVPNVGWLTATGHIEVVTLESIDHITRHVILDNLMPLIYDKQNN